MKNDDLIVQKDATSEIIEVFWVQKRLFPKAMYEDLQKYVA